ncbi:hypothetical protein ACROYT_G013734 [Oculina patagonica]
MPHNAWCFTMDIKSLYTVIPNGEGLRALKYYLDKREVLEPPTDTLLRMAELVLTLNTFEFNGEFYKQTGGVAMGSRLGPNYACLFVGYVEERMLLSYAGTKPDLYKRCKSSIPYSQFLRLRKICSENDDFESEANKMETFFEARGYPNDLIRRGRERASIKSRAELLENNSGNNTANDRVPLVTTFHPMNQDACKIISGNFKILHDDSTTNNIFRKPPLMAFRRAKNLKDLLVRSSLPQDPPNHPTATGPFAAHAPMLTHLTQFQHPRGMLTSQVTSPIQRRT